MIIIYILLIGFTFSSVKTVETKQLTLQGFQPMTGNGWTGGAGCLPGALMALRHVNERSDILEGYNLTYLWADTQCNAGLATYELFQALSQPPTKIMILGCGCSTESEVTAQVSHLFNVTQLSYGSSSPILSDRKRFPNFFRLGGPDQKQNPAKIALLREFSWRKVATINQALEFFSVVIDDFVKSVKGTDITIISQEIFEHDPLTRVENLKKRDARIIITACYEDKARLMLCHAYKIGLYGPKIVWMFPGWYSGEFWRRNLDNVPCTLEEMEEAADGAFIFAYYFKNPNKDERGLTGLTVSEFEDLYRQEETYDPANTMFDFAGGPCYDHIWIAALALNCTDDYLKRTGHPKTLDQFTYKDSDINDIVLSCMSNVSMTGITGSVAFGEGADPIKNIKLQRIQDRQRVTVGTYLMDQDPMKLEWNNVGVKWKDGNIPRDSTYVTYEEISIPFALYTVTTSLSALGIVSTIVFFSFNIIFRRNRIVKLSSPNINNILLIGCVLTYSTVFLKTTGMVSSAICKTRTFCFSLGFTIAFGALFSKTWRVYKIFTNKKLLKVSIKDYQLIGIVCALSGGIIFILVLWEILGPQYLVRKDLTKEIYLSGNDAEVRPFVSVCYSEYGVYFSWTIYIIEGTLLAFGAFLAWETRHVDGTPYRGHAYIPLRFGERRYDNGNTTIQQLRQVKIEALNDSHQIGLCLYNVVVLSAVALTLSLLLEDNVVMLYGVTSSCIIIGTTMTQFIVFIPKIVVVHQSSSVNVITVESNVVSKQSQSQSQSIPSSSVATGKLVTSTTIANSASGSIM